MTRRPTTSRLRRHGHVIWALTATSGVWVALSSCQSPARRDRETRALEQGRLEQLRDSLWPQLLTATGTPTKPAPPLAIVERADAERLIAVAVAEQYRAGELATLETTYRALGLLPPMDALIDHVRRALHGQVLGLYDPSSRRMVMVRDGALLDARRQPTPIARLILAHELVHAAQDGILDLRALPKDRRNLDRQLATQAALEGHAVWASLRVLFPDADDGAMAPAILAALTQAVDTGKVWREVPPMIRESVIFPYRAGTAYLARIAAGPGPWRLPKPTATQDVLWEDRDGTQPVAPEPIAWPPVPASSRGTNTLGVFGTLQVLAQRGPVDSTDARRLRRGWRGDRWVLTGPDSAATVTWDSCWDTASTALRVTALTQRLPTVTAAQARLGVVPFCAANVQVRFQTPPRPPAPSM